jgi:hypothetical protein
MGPHPFWNDKSSNEEVATQTERRRVDLVNLDPFRHDTLAGR